MFKYPGFDRYLFNHTTVCPKNNINPRIKTKPVMVGTGASVKVWYMIYANKSRTFTNASVQVMFGPVFKWRIRICLAQCWLLWCLLNRNFLDYVMLRSHPHLPVKCLQVDLSGKNQSADYAITSNTAQEANANVCTHISYWNRFWQRCACIFRGRYPNCCHECK